jgi:transcription antitermination factor NusG
LNSVNHETIELHSFKPGTEVRIIAGPLQHSEGKILEIKKNKARLQIDALGTIITAEVSLNHILV